MAKNQTCHLIILSIHLYAELYYISIFATTATTDSTTDTNADTTADATAIAANKTWIFKRKMSVVSLKH